MSEESSQPTSPPSVYLSKSKCYKCGEELDEVFIGRVRGLYVALCVTHAMEMRIVKPNSVWEFLHDVPKKHSND